MIVRYQSSRSGLRDAARWRRLAPGQVPRRPRPRAGPAWRVPAPRCGVNAALISMSSWIGSSGPAPESSQNSQGRVARDAECDRLAAPGIPSRSFCALVTQPWPMRPGALNAQKLEAQSRPAGNVPANRTKRDRCPLKKLMLVRRSAGRKCMRARGGRAAGRREHVLVAGFFAEVPVGRDRARGATPVAGADPRAYVSCTPTAREIADGSRSTERVADGRV